MPAAAFDGADRFLGGPFTRDIGETTLAPKEPKRSATALPMPRAEPVMRATLFLRLVTAESFLRSGGWGRRKAPRACGASLTLRLNRHTARDFDALGVDPAIVVGQQRSDHGAD